MTKDEFATLSAVIQPQTTIYTPVFRGPSRMEGLKSFRHSFYPMSKLSVLIDLLKKMPLDTFDEDNFDIFSVRYLVTTDKQILFAREGEASKLIPGHRQMRSKCIAAGNIFFSRDFKFITKINHQSGDFHPSASSLFWPLAILHAMQAPLAEQFTIEISGVFNEDFALCSETVTTLEELKALIPQDILPQLISANSSDVIEVEEKNMNMYGSKGHKSIFSHPLLLINRECSASSSPTSSFSDAMDSNKLQRLVAPELMPVEDPELSGNEQPRNLFF